MEQVKKYHAFISYSHKDKQYARAIQKSIETLGIPFYKSWQPNVNIFRDERKIPLAGSLTEQIITGLKESQYLIVIASKYSANSTWVREEIINWHKWNKDDVGFISNFNFILTDDVVEWDYLNHDFDKLKTTALPSFDERLFKELPLWANIQQYCKDGKIKSSNSNYEWEIAKIKGLLLGKKPDEIIDEVSKGKRFFRLVSSFIIMVLLLATTFAYYQRNVAIEQRNLAISNSLISSAQRILETDPTQALRLAEEALKITPTKLAQNIANNIYANNNFYKILYRNNHGIISFSQFKNGNILLVPYNDSIIKVIDVKGNLIKEFHGHSKYINTLTLSKNQKFILSGGEDNIAKLWSDNGKLLQNFEGHQQGILSVAISNNSNLILTGSKDGTAILWNNKGEIKRVFKDHDRDVNSVAFHPNDSLILTGSQDGKVKLWDLNGKCIRTLENNLIFVNSVVFSPDGKYILTGSLNEKAQLWDLNGKLIREFIGHNNAWNEPASVTSVAFSNNGK